MKTNALTVFLKCFAVSIGIAFCVFLCANRKIITEELLIPVFACVAAILLVYLIVDLTRPYFNNRRAAMKAMGKDGYKAVMKDKVARIAYKGVYAFMKGDLVTAEELLTKALHLSDVRQNQVFCIEWLIHVHEQYNDNSKLLWCYRKAVEYSPDNPEVQSRLGHAYFVEGRLDKAMYCFEQAIHYDPNHGYSHYSIAKIHIARGEDDKAIKVLEDLTKIQENHPLIFAELATIYAMNGNDDKCREYYEKAIMCGYERPDVLSKRMTAIYDFNNAKGADGSDLPTEYYRHIDKGEETQPKKTCSSSCEHCDLNRNKTCEKGENDAGNE